MDHLLARGLRCIWVIDVSAAALARAKTRLGPVTSAVTWIEADVTSDWSGGVADIWHDRAAFHFLTDAEDRARYVEHARQHVKRGGYLMLATFGFEGPPTCSGLPIVRYSAESLAAEMGSAFALLESVSESHTTPAGAVQQFQYAVFRHLDQHHPKG